MKESTFTNAKINQAILREHIDKSHKIWKRIIKAEKSGKLSDMDMDIIRQEMIMSNQIMKQIALQTHLGIQLLQFRKIA